MKLRLPIPLSTMPMLRLFPARTWIPWAEAVTLVWMRGVLAKGRLNDCLMIPPFLMMVLVVMCKLDGLRATPPRYPPGVSRSSLPLVLILRDMGLLISVCRWILQQSQGRLQLLSQGSALRLVTAWGIRRRWSTLRSAAGRQCGPRMPSAMPKIRL